MLDAAKGERLWPYRSGFAVDGGWSWRPRSVSLAWVEPDSAAASVSYLTGG